MMAFLPAPSSKVACRPCHSNISLYEKALCRKTYCFRTDRRNLVTRVRPCQVSKPTPLWTQRVVCSLTKVAETFMLFYALLLAGGGIAGYVRVKSTASITSGVVSGLVLAYAWYEKSIPVALAVSVVLVVVSAIRYSKSKKFMPAGLLGLVSTCACVIFALALRT
ncbi:hypothetical protein GAYE_PCTG10G0485 [Galdieria yellowstonensis]|uniref:Transmembrane protein 14 n=1 Tax=Galdieria yellowstonensis TaxID=3028027 RepID=A0AAV9I3I0_9RHOD|nr:hypothetical protein GAYE_PCTG10G0485 [Galdieria yellowstonensis]